MRGPSGIVGRRGDRVPAHLDRLVQIRRIPGAFESGQQQLAQFGRVRPIGCARAGARLLDPPVQPGRLVAERGPGPQREVEVGHHRGVIGVIGPAGDRGLAGLDSGVQVGPARQVLEPGQQRVAQVGQVAGAGGLVGSASPDRRPAELDRLGQVGREFGAFEPGQQRAAQVGQASGVVGVVGSGHGDGPPQQVDGPVQRDRVVVLLRLPQLRPTELGQHRGPVRLGRRFVVPQFADQFGNGAVVQRVQRGEQIQRDHQLRFAVHRAAGGEPQPEQPARGLRDLDVLDRIGHRTEQVHHLADRVGAEHDLRRTSGGEPVDPTADLPDPMIPRRTLSRPLVEFHLRGRILFRAALLGRILRGRLEIGPDHRTDRIVFR